MCGPAWQEVRFFEHGQIPVGHFRCGFESVELASTERLLEPSIQAMGDLGTQRTRRRELACVDRNAGYTEVLSLEGKRPGQTAVNHDRDRPKIGSKIDVL